MSSRWWQGEGDRVESCLPCTTMPGLTELLGERDAQMLERGRLPGRQLEPFEQLMESRVLA